MYKNVHLRTDRRRSRSSPSHTSSCHNAADYSARVDAPCTNLSSVALGYDLLPCGIMRQSPILWPTRRLAALIVATPPLIRLRSATANPGDSHSGRGYYPTFSLPRKRRCECYVFNLYECYVFNLCKRQRRMISMISKILYAYAQYAIHISVDLHEVFECLGRGRPWPRGKGLNYPPSCMGRGLFCPVDVREG